AEGPAAAGIASGSAGAGAGGSPGSTGSGSASAVPALSTSTQPIIDATPAAFAAAKRLPLVQPLIHILRSRLDAVSHISTGAICSRAAAVPPTSKYAVRQAIWRFPCLMSPTGSQVVASVRHVAANTQAG